PGQEHRQARGRARQRIPSAEGDPRRGAHGRPRARPAQGRARCLRAPRSRQGDGGVARRRGNRRGQQLAVPRAAHLHDGRPAQHHVLYPSSVLFQEHRAHGRSRHQHRRDRALHRGRPRARRRAPERRELHGDALQELMENAMTARILIVEDEEPLTLLLRYNLEAEGYEVETSARGDEAEIRLKESPPDLLVLDWMLPGMSGIELCRRLRARATTERMPIIMLTARGEESERVRGLSTGADDYIVKPFSVPELLARIRSLLRRAKP